MLTQRRKLLTFLRRSKFDVYAALISRLGLKDTYSPQVGRGAGARGAGAALLGRQGGAVCSWDGATGRSGTGAWHAWVARAVTGPRLAAPRPAGALAPTSPATCAVLPCAGPLLVPLPAGRPPHQVVSGGGGAEVAAAAAAAIAGCRTAEAGSHLLRRLGVAALGSHSPQRVASVPCLGAQRRLSGMQDRQVGFLAAEWVAVTPMTGCLEQLCKQ